MNKTLALLSAAAVVGLASTGHAALTQTQLSPATPALTGYTATVPTFESSVGQPQQGNVNNNYSIALSGYFTPSTSGLYDFAIASDDGGKLLLSTDSNPANAAQIAFEENWNGARNYQADSGDTNINDQQSGLSTNPGGITLVGGVSYYVYAEATEGGGGDNLSVAIAKRPTGGGATNFSNFLPYSDDQGLGTLTVNPVPEPTTFGLLGIGALGFLARYRSRRA